MPAEFIGMGSVISNVPAFRTDMETGWSSMNGVRLFKRLDQWLLNGIFKAGLSGEGFCRVNVDDTKMINVSAVA